MGWSMGIGGGVRDPDHADLDNGISKVIENFETGDKRNVLGIIAIHVADLLISGSSEFAEYISREMRGISNYIDMGG